MKRTSLILASCFFAATIAHADNVYTNAAAFTAAAGALNTTIDFNGQSGGYFTTPSDPFTESGSTLTYTGSGYIVSASGFYGSSYAGGDFFTTDYSLDSLTVTLPSTLAVSFNYGGIFGSATIGVLLSDGFSTTLSTGDSITGTDTLDFAGITSTTPLTSITFTLPDSPNYNALDNIAFNATSATPEPSSLALLSTGLVGIGGMIRRKLRS